MYTMPVDQPIANSNSSDSGNPPTGLSIAIIPSVLAAGAVIAVFTKKKKK